MMSFIWFGRGTRTLNGFFFSAYMYTEVDIHTWLETEVTGSSLAWYHGKLATCSFFPALWTQYCSSAHSLHSACTRNKKPTWNLEPRWCKKKQKKKSLASGPGLAPADSDMAIREAHPAMALLPLGQSQQISRCCQHCCFICPPHISPGSHTTGGRRKAASDLPLCS